MVPDRMADTGLLKDSTSSQQPADKPKTAKQLEKEAKKAAKLAKFAEKQAKTSDKSNDVQQKKPKKVEEVLTYGYYFSVSPVSLCCIVGLYCIVVHLCS